MYIRELANLREIRKSRKKPSLVARCHCSPAVGASLAGNQHSKNIPASLASFNLAFPP